MRPQFDEKDQTILDDRQRLFDSLEGPRVGDYVKMPDGTIRRFTYDWGQTIQTTSEPRYSESFHLCKSGRASYSGALDPGIPKDKLTDTGKRVRGSFWFFHHDVWQAHNGVDFTVPCRLYQYEATHA